MAISCNAKPYLTPKSQALATSLAFLTVNYFKADLSAHNPFRDDLCDCRAELDATGHVSPPNPPASA